MLILGTSLTTRQQVGLIALAMLVTRSSVASLQTKQGLPLGTQAVGWITLGASTFCFFPSYSFNLCHCYPTLVGRTHSNYPLSTAPGQAARPVWLQAVTCATSPPAATDMVIHFDLSNAFKGKTDWKNFRSQWRQLPLFPKIMAVLLMIVCLLPILIIYLFWLLFWELPMRACRRRSAMDRGLHSPTYPPRSASNTSVVPQGERPYTLVITGTNVHGMPQVERRPGSSRTPSFASSFDIGYREYANSLSRASLLSRDSGPKAGDLEAARKHKHKREAEMERASHRPSTVVESEEQEVSPGTSLGPASSRAHHSTLSPHLDGEPLQHLI